MGALLCSASPIYPTIPEALCNEGQPRLNLPALQLSLNGVFVGWVPGVGSGELCTGLVTERAVVDPASGSGRDQGCCDIGCRVTRGEVL